MLTAPMQIPGITGAVMVNVNAWTGKRKLFVDGAEVPTTRGSFEFTGAFGQPVSGQIKRLMPWEVYPRVAIGDVIHRTGEEPPVWLKVVAGLPILLAAGGLLGLLIGFLGVIANFEVIRTGAARGAVVAISIGTLLVCAVVLLIVAGLIGAAIRM
ncbi:hypothetical protein JDV09_11330 [Mycobacterium sp. Y57]|uniref:hypothetical protein n=1 Tax=Mycolicibacterium xanthum TaxID=2796469 RepID=UPI001C8644DE|nr:hypothetical protein [Mycolicibacterium xanthum]MBX7432691.1 hypothetical protein [Mycolicibacterium xanthum]